LTAATRHLRENGRIMVPAIAVRDWPPRTLRHAIDGQPFPGIVYCLSLDGMLLEKLNESVSRDARARAPRALAGCGTRRRGSAAELAD